jgi:hypothetical protein
MSNLKRQRQHHVANTRQVQPGLTPDEPGVVDAFDTAPAGRGFCPECGTLTHLSAPPKSKSPQSGNIVCATNSAYGGNADINIDGSRQTKSFIASNTTCSLCRLTDNTEKRGVAVRDGLFWYLVADAARPVEQWIINQRFWGVIEKPSVKERIAARLQLLYHLVEDETAKRAVLPNQVFTGYELDIIEVHIGEVCGQMAYANMSMQERSVMQSTLGVQHLLENYDPAWSALVRFFLTEKGVEHFANLLSET